MTLLEARADNARFPLGSLVNARGRDWVVLPSDDEEMLRLRPLGGSDEDAVGLYLPLEGDEVRSASIQPPDLNYVGDATAGALLRESARLGFRAAAGPLRSLGRIAVEPRPYQLVPLLMALRLEPVRLLIGDDVGIGKTIEAALVARELYDRGEIRRFAVLCPPQLCEQWQKELRDKFHLDPVVVRPGTVARLERDLGLDRGIFDEYPFVVVSIDYIKSDRRRADFLRACPEMVIVDEAHAVAQPGATSGSQHQRHSLVSDLAKDPNRHIILATATPHSGDEAAFASLIGLLDPRLERAVLDMDFGNGSRAREELAHHFVQRRRGDVAQGYLGEDTPFPTRVTGERTYRLGTDYQRLLERVLSYAQEIVRGAQGLSRFQQRVHWWAALALLRCVSSSPAAAATALRTRAPAQENSDPLALDRAAAGLVLDLDAVDDATQDDSTPGVDTIAAEDPTANERRRLLDLARVADELRGDKDPKLAEATKVVNGLLAEGFRPIVFCRYVATAKYVTEEMGRRLRGTEVRAVTGELPPEEREDRVVELAAFPKRVLVATDCLSEGVNLQEHFDAIVHYDLSWNPTRHEQREGRVDRYGQPSKEVRTVLLYGQDNRVDGAVLKVLLRKAETIRKRLGVSVPVPVDSNAVLEAIFESLFLRQAPAEQLQLDLGLEQAEEQVGRAWEQAADREKRTRTIFAQQSIHASEVEAEIKDARRAIGSARDVEWFVRQAASRFEAPMVPSTRSGIWELDLNKIPDQVLSRADLLDAKRVLPVSFDLPAPDGVTYLARTHQFVEALSGYLLDTALDQPAAAVAKRAGAMRSDLVRERTALLILRARYLIHETRDGQAFVPMLAEEVLVAGFCGTPDAPTWLADDEVEALMRARPVGNVLAGQATAWLSAIERALPALQDGINDAASRRGAAALEAHRRVRHAANIRGVRQRVEPHLPPDLLGLYVLMPPPVTVGIGGR